MTDVQMDAGPECDVAVAEAIGLQVGCRVFGVGQWQCEHVTGGDWRPSTDWNDALFAAEKFGLFVDSQYPNSPRCGLAVYDGEWCVMEHVAAGEFDRDFGKAPTGPLAICRAILALHARR